MSQNAEEPRIPFEANADQAVYHDAAEDMVDLESLNTQAAEAAGDDEVYCDAVENMADGMRMATQAAGSGESRTGPALGGEQDVAATTSSNISPANNMQESNAGNVRETQELEHVMGDVSNETSFGSTARGLTTGEQDAGETGPSPSNPKILGQDMKRSDGSRIGIAVQVLLILQAVVIGLLIWVLYDLRVQLDATMPISKVSSQLNHSIWTLANVAPPTSEVSGLVAAGSALTSWHSYLAIIPDTELTVSQRIALQLAANEAMSKLKYAADHFYEFQRSGDEIASSGSWNADIGCLIDQAASSDTFRVAKRSIWSAIIADLKKMMDLAAVVGGNHGKALEGLAADAKHGICETCDLAA